MALFLYTDSLESVTAFLRLEGDLNKISSKRWIGIVGMWSFLLHRHLPGLGFGAADNQISHLSE